jgi:hypothetical protein
VTAENSLRDLNRAEQRTPWKQKALLLPVQLGNSNSSELSGGRALAESNRRRFVIGQEQHRVAAAFWPSAGLNVAHPVGLFAVNNTSAPGAAQNGHDRVGVVQCFFDMEDERPQDESQTSVARCEVRADCIMHAKIGHEWCACKLISARVSFAAASRESASRDSLSGRGLRYRHSGSSIV